ncbi:hypothetical protein, partial [Acinetobacter baumannii]
MTEEINRQELKNNWAVGSKAMENSKVYAVVKANAYR